MISVYVKSCGSSAGVAVGAEVSVFADCGAAEAGISVVFGVLLAVGYGSSAAWSAQAPASKRMLIRQIHNIKNLRFFFIMIPSVSFS